MHKTAQNFWVTKYMSVKTMPQRETVTEQCADTSNGNVILHVSREVIKNKLLSLEAMKVVTRHGKETWVSKGRTYMIDNEAHEIVSQFNTEIRGFYNHYSIANNASALGRSFGCIMKFSMYKTLAQKLNMSVRKVIERYRKDNLFAVPFVNKGGETKYRVFYNEGYARKTDCETAPSDNLPYMFKNAIVESDRKAYNKTCELCGKHGEVVMHHVRTLKELKGKKTGNAKCSICTERLWSYVRSVTQKSRDVSSKMMLQMESRIHGDVRYGSGAGKRKPTAVKWKGVVCRAYK